jgi:diguanylate cyclase (GGDEF)-like protein
MSDIMQNGADPLTPYTAGQKPLKIPANTPALADPLAEAKQEFAATAQAKASGQPLADPLDEANQQFLDTSATVSTLKAQSPWLSNYSGVKISDINRMIAADPDPIGAIDRIGTAAQFASISGVPLSSALENLDAYSKYWTGKPYIPKTTARVLTDYFNAGKMQMDMGNLAFQWSLSGGGDDGTMAKLDAMQAKIDELSEDSVPLVWQKDALLSPAINAFKSGLWSALKSTAMSAPGMISGALKGGAVVAGVGLLAAAAGTEYFSAGLGTPLAAGAAISGLSLIGSSVDMYQYTQGKAYYDLIKQGHSRDVAVAVSSMSAFLQSATEGLVAEVPGLGAITGGGGLDTALTKMVAKRTAQSGIFNMIGVGLTRIATNAIGEGAEEFIQGATDLSAQSFAQAIEDVGYEGPVPEEALKSLGKQFVGGMLVAGIMGGVGGDYVSAFKGDFQQAAYIKGRARAAMDQGLDFAQFSGVMRGEYGVAEAQGYAPVLSEFDEETRDKMTKALWDAGKREQTTADAKAKAAQEKAGLAAPDIGDEEAAGAPVVRDTSDRLYTQNRVVTTDDNGEIRSVFKLGDPTAKGKSKRLASIDYETDGETLTIREVTGKIDADTKREFILDLLEQNPGKTVDWRPKSEEDQAVYDGLVRDNPRGPEAGIQWYSEKGTIDKVRTREALNRQLRTFVGKTDLKAEQIPVMAATIDNFAQSLGMETDELIQNMMSDKGLIAGIPKAPIGEKPEQTILRQTSRGSTSFERVSNALKAVIYFGQKADATTFFHESFHAYQSMLIGNRALNDKFTAKAAEFESAFGVQGGDWDAEATGLWTESYLKKARAEGRNLSFKEAAAYAFEEYLRTGKAPTEEQRGIFQKIARWFYDIYQAIAPKVKMNADITRVFDSLMGGSGPLSEIAQESQAQEAQQGEALYQPGMSDEQKTAFFENRNKDLRDIRVEDMTEAQKEEALLTHELTGIPNRRAYAEDIEANGGKPYPIQVSLDADSLKWVNDNMGHHAGDAMLKRIGDALMESSESNGFLAYHVSGDEFIAQGNDLDSILRGLNDIENKLKGAILEEETLGADGSKITLDGISVSAGIDDKGALKDADHRLDQEKRLRESEGTRAPRGEIPPAVRVIRESGEALSNDDARAAILERQRETSAVREAEGPSPSDALSPQAIRARREQLKAEELYQGARDIDRVVYTFPPELKAFSDIHSPAQFSGILNAFGRGVISPDGKDIRIGDAGTSHVGLARGMTDAKRFYFGYSREKQAVYVVAKNGMDTDLFKRPAVLKNVLSQVFDKYKLSVAAGKKLQFMDKDVPGTLFQEAAPTDSPEFKAWFGDSKVVDNKGKPLVVYHGSPDARGIVSPDGKFSTHRERAYGKDDGRTYFFTNSRGAAKTYAVDSRAFDYQNAEPATIPAYVSLKNPLEINGRGTKWGGPKGQQEIVDKARSEGRDGIIIRDTIDDYTTSGIVPIDVYVAFSPEQIKSVNNRGTWDPADPRILYQGTVDDLEKSARTFKTWEEFRDFNEATSTDDPSDMSPQEKDAFYKNIFDQAAMQEATPNTESVDDEADDAQFSEEIKTDAGLRAYLLDLFGAAYDKDFIRDVERVGPSDAEEAARYDAMKRAESIVERSAAPAVYLGAQGVASGKASSKILSAARTIILNNPTEYRRLAALAQGDEDTAGRLEAKIAKPYILDPRWIQAAATLTIEKRRRLARTIKNEKLARKIARGNITVEDKDLADHIDYLTEEAKALRKSIAEKEAQTQELDDRLGTTQRIALKQERALREYQDRLALVEKRAKAYQDRQATIPAKTEAERKLLTKQIQDTQAALAKARTDSKTDAAYLDSMASTLATQKERNRLKAMESERRALKGVRDEMRHLAAMATKPLGKNARVILEYKKKIEELQKQLDPTFRTAKTLEKLDHWRDFLANDPGAAEMMPDHLIRQVQAKPLNDWTLDELKVFKERIDALRQAGATTWKVRHNAEQEARKLLSNDLKSAALAGKEFRPSVGRAKPSNVFTKGMLETFKPLAVFLTLDGDKHGAFTTWFFDKYNEAVAKKNNQVARRKAKVGAKLKELNFTLDPLDTKRTYVGKEVDIDGFTYSNGRKPTIQDIAYWSIGLQNENTKRALLAGDFLPEEVMNKAVQSMTPEQHGLAAAIADDFQENMPRSAEAFEYQYNMPFNPQASYVPMRRLGVTYDTRGEEVAVGLVSSSGQIKTFVKNGHLKGRKDITDAYQTPIRTDLVSLWAEAVEQEEAFISEDWLIKRLQDVANRPEISRSIQQRLGPEGVRWFKKYINDIAQGDANQALTGTQKLMQNLRGRMAVSYLSFNVLSNLKQLVSVLPYIADANPFHIVGAAGQYLAGITGKENKLTAFVHARSDIIKNRKISRDFEDVKRMEASNQASPIMRNAVEIEKRIGAWGMQSLEVIDHVSVCIGWKAVYDNKISKGMSELEAIQAADDATVLTQPSGRVQDLAQIYRSGETMKMFTMFTNALNAQWNMMAYRIPAAIRQKKYLHAVGDAVALALCGLGIALVSGAAYGGDDEDKKKRLVVGLFSQYTDSLPLVGSYVTSALERGAGVKTFVPSGVTPFPWGANVVNTVGAITQGDVNKAFANIIEGTAYGVGLPVSEPKRAWKAFVEKNPALLLGWKKE